MSVATLRRVGGPSVDVRLFGESGDLTIARDVGKPNQSEYEVGREDPRTQDNQSAQDRWTLTGILLGENAYADARTLAADVVKPRLESPLELDLTATGRGTYDVVPAQAEACTLTYVPGDLDVVGAQLSLGLVDTLNGGTQAGTDPTTPPSGSGITLARGATSVTLTADAAVTRTVGRPSIQLNPSSRELPVAIDQNAPASDVWELSGTLLTDAQADAETLAEDIIRARLGSGSLTLSFNGGAYGLAEYQVAPTGSQALRTTANAGEKGVVNVPTIEVRSVDNS